jgi:preprotein translocase subunit SecA
MSRVRLPVVELPACQVRVIGQGVHVVTLGEDLARRDAERMGDV